MSDTSSRTWRRFRRNKPALIGALVIVILAVISFLGALIRPDQTIHANDQVLSIAGQKPGFEVDLLVLNDDLESQSKWELWWEGGHELRGEKYALAVGSGVSDKEGTLCIEEFGSSDKRCFENVRSSRVEHRIYWLGTDKYGRDLLSRLMAGTVISLAVGAIAVVISLLVGLVLGLIAGYYRGWVDALIMWFINVVWAVPTLLLVMAITFAFGTGFWKVFLAVGLTMWVEVARIARGVVLSLREKEYVEAARALGYRDMRIIFRHILPGIWSPVIVISAANFASAILIEAGLSFLGLGAQIPTPSWGNMIREHYAYITTDMAYLAIVPGALIMVLVLSFMMVGNGLRDALDVKG